MEQTTTPAPTPPQPKKRGFIRKLFKLGVEIGKAAPDPAVKILDIPAHGARPFAIISGKC